jgi:hypothetical protein
LPTERSARRDAVSVLSITVRRPVISAAIGWNDIGSGAGARCTLRASCCKNRSGSGVGAGGTAERGATAVIGVAEFAAVLDVAVLDVAVFEVAVFEVAVLDVAVFEVAVAVVLGVAEFAIVVAVFEVAEFGVAVFDVDVFEVAELAVFVTAGEPFDVSLAIPAEDLALASGPDGPRPTTPATLRCTLRSDESAGILDVAVASVAAVGCNERCDADAVAGCLDGSRSARISAPVPGGTTIDRAAARLGIAGASVGRERLGSALRWTVDDSAGPALAALCCFGVRRVSLSAKRPVLGAVSVRPDAAEGCRVATLDCGAATPDCGVVTPDCGAALNCGAATPDCGAALNCGAVTADCGVVTPDCGVVTPDCGAALNR